MIAPYIPRPTSAEVQTAIDGVPFKLGSNVLLQGDANSCDISSISQMITKINSFNWDEYEYSFQLEKSVLQEFSSREEPDAEWNFAVYVISFYFISFLNSVYSNIFLLLLLFRKSLKSLDELCMHTYINDNTQFRLKHYHTILYFSLSSILLSWRILKYRFHRVSALWTWW